MKISINGLAELIMFIKNNDTLIQNENFPRILKNLYKQHILLQSGCKCLVKTRLGILQQSFSKLQINEEEQGKLKIVFPNGFEIYDNAKILITT